MKITKTVDFDAKEDIILILMEIFIIIIIDLKISVISSALIWRGLFPVACENIVHSSNHVCIPEPEGQCCQVNSHLAGGLLSDPLRAVLLSRRCFHWAVSFFLPLHQHAKKGSASCLLSSGIILHRFTSIIFSLLDWHILRLHSTIFIDLLFIYSITKINRHYVEKKPWASYYICAIIDFWHIKILFWNKFIFICELWMYQLFIYYVLSCLNDACILSI